MLRTRVIPVLLLKDKGLVKSIKFNKFRYVGDPINAVKIFNEKEVDELIFLDITATREDRKPDFQYIEDIASECFMPLAYGGGIKSIDDIEKLFKIGIEKVIINTAALKNQLSIREASSLFGSQSIIVSIDAKRNLFGKYRIYRHKDLKIIKLEPEKFAENMEIAGAGEIFINSVDRDGTMQGCDLQLIKQVSEQVNIPVIACGGIGTLSDFSQAVIEGGASAVAAGSFFVFHGKLRAVLITYPDYEELERLLGNDNPG